MMSIGHELLIRPRGSETSAQFGQSKTAIRYALDL